MRNKVTVAVVVILAAIIVVVITILIVLRVKKVKLEIGKSYSDSFEELYQDMRANYVLTEHKGIDWDGLYEKYMPLVAAADEAGDEKAYVNAVLDFTQEFHDSHIILDDYGKKTIGKSSSLLDRCVEERFPSNYDMAVLQLDSGEYVAVNVLPDGVAARSGMKEGDVLTKWNGKPMEDAINELEGYVPLLRWNFANSANEAYLKPLYLAALSGDEVSVELADGTVIQMQSSGNGYEYLDDTLRRLLTRVNQGKNVYFKEGMMHYEMREDHAYVCVSNLASDDGKEFEEELTALSKEMEGTSCRFLLLDLRNNSGGFDDRGAELFSYFVKDKRFYLAERTYSPDTKEYTWRRDITVEGKGLFDLPIYILVNSNCVSAGEAFVYRMKELSNVTVIGSSNTNGSLATFEGYTVLPAGLMIHYPYLACTTEDGTILIDSGVGVDGGNAPDVYIPHDREFIHKMFQKDYSIDYELDFALEYARK